MGLLGTSFLAGAGHGLNVLGGALMKGAEKDQDEILAERRMKVLADIQRQSASGVREDAFKFENDPGNVATAVSTATTKAKAAGMLARDEAVLNETNQPLRDARTANADADADAARERELKALDAKWKDPRYTESVRQEAKVKADALREESRIKGDEAIRVAGAHVQSLADAGAYGNRDGSLKLPPGVDRAVKGLEGIENDIRQAIIKAKAEGVFDPAKNKNHQELMNDLADTRRARDRLLAPYLPAAPGGAEPDDPYRVRPPKKDGAPAAPAVKTDAPAKKVEAPWTAEDMAPDSDRMKAFRAERDQANQAGMLKSEEAKDRLRSEISGITVESVRNMSPEQARKTLGMYRSVLAPDLIRALNKRQ
ncbi:MAG: hypothetical protein RL030_1796 [Pseudomonadota bacterium]|jgi:hypothetical protein